VHSSLNGGSVEEFGVAFAFLQPSYSGLLFPVDFLLLLPFLNLFVDTSFLFQGSFRVSLCDYFLMEIRQFPIEVLLRFEDISKGFSVPSL